MIQPESTPQIDDSAEARISYGRSDSGRPNGWEDYQMKYGKKPPTGFFIGMGIIVGVVVGALTGSVGVWIAIGLVVGAAIEYTFAKKRSSE